MLCIKSFLSKCNTDRYHIGDKNDFDLVKIKINLLTHDARPEMYIFNSRDFQYLDDHN